MSRRRRDILDSTALFTAAELGRMHFPPLHQIVPGIIVEGLTILAGPPKIGKSYLLLQCCVAVASGSNLLGEIPCAGGDVLYLALEDSPRRLKHRLQQLLGDQQDFPERLTFSARSPSVSEKLTKLIEEWMAKARAPALVVIDTWRCVKPEPTGRSSAYDDDAKAIQPLHELTKAHPGLALLVVHHTRKQEAVDAFDTISGTYGLTGVADTLLVMARHGDGHKLCIRGRDVEDAEKALQRDRQTGAWRITGDARELAKTGERQEILDILAQAEKPMTPTQIATVIGKQRDNVQHLLKRLEKEGHVRREGHGKWVHHTPVHFDHSVHSCTDTEADSEQNEQSERESDND